jgi:hypothetical protein
VCVCVYVCVCMCVCMCVCVCVCVCVCACPVVFGLETSIMRWSEGELDYFATELDYCVTEKKSSKQCAKGFPMSGT